MVASLALLAIDPPSTLLADDPPGPAAVGRSHRLLVSLGDGSEGRAGEIDLYAIPAGDGGERVLIVSTEDLPGLPLSSIRRPAPASVPTPDLCDLREGRVVQAIADWIEAREMLADEWWVEGSEGIEKIRRTRLVPRTPIELRRTCAVGEAGRPLLRMRLESPVIQEGTIRTELRELDWSFERDGTGEILRAEMRHTVIRAVEAIEESVTAAIAIETLAAAPLDEAQTRALAREYELLATATRRLLPGSSADTIASAGELLASHRSEYPQGLLAAVVPPLEALLAKRSEEAAGGSPDERAQALVGKVAPDFRLDDLDGAAVELVSLRGKPVVLSFWGYT